jgi:hypothetical protein
MTGDDTRNDRDPNLMERVEITRWRKAKRERLIAARLATSIVQHGRRRSPTAVGHGVTV